jgi:hypothetical protein
VSIDLAIAHGSGRFVEGRAGDIATGRRIKLASRTGRDLRYVLVDSGRGGLTLRTRRNGGL